MANEPAVQMTLGHWMDKVKGLQAENARLRERVATLAPYVDHLWHCGLMMQQRVCSCELADVEAALSGQDAEPSGSEEAGS